ncbi:MAG: N-acetyl-alpha-D-glucosaminyl L-malate synthase [Alphaproteobacteria bacterium]|nr:MAG: N-acetyl-alpha-D-glucosaminyl L-malate synthase [Alphaproteobacteria bacterium]
MSNRFQMPSTDAVDLTGRTILQVVPELETGGAEITTMEMAEAIVKAGGRALVASEGGALESRIEAAGGEIVHMPVASKNPVTLWRNVGRLAKLMHAENVDLIHGRSRAPCWSALFAAKRTQTPYVTTFHSTVHGTPRAKVLYNSSLVRGQVSIANSHFTAARIEAIYPWAKSRLRVIPRGCDERALAQDNFSSADRLAKRAEWDVDEDAFVIICPARITHLKGQHVLIEALGQIDHTLKPKLVLVGSAQGRENYVSDLKNQAAALGLSHRLVFAGLETNMPSAYAAADLAIVPTIRPEPFGRTIIEAQAAGLPVIGSDAGGYRETIIAKAPEEGGTGWLAEMGNAAALAAQISAALTMPKTAFLKLGENGRANVLANYTRNAMCNRTLNVYQECLS